MCYYSILISQDGKTIQNLKAAIIKFSVILFPNNESVISW